MVRIYIYSLIRRIQLYPVPSLTVSIGMGTTEEQHILFTLSSSGPKSGKRMWVLNSCRSQCPNQVSSEKPSQAAALHLMASGIYKTVSDNTYIDPYLSVIKPWWAGVNCSRNSSVHLRSRPHDENTNIPHLACE